MCVETPRRNYRVKTIKVRRGNLSSRHRCLNEGWTAVDKREKRQGNPFADSYIRPSVYREREAKNKSNCKCIRREARLQSSRRNWSEAWLHHRSGDFVTRVICSRRRSPLPRDFPRSLPSDSRENIPHRPATWKCKLAIRYSLVSYRVVREPEPFHRGFIGENLTAGLRDTAAGIK